MGSGGHISRAAVRWAGHGIRLSHLQGSREVGGSRDPVVASPGQVPLATHGLPKAGG